MYHPDLCSSLRGLPAPHRRSPGSPPPALEALSAQGEVEEVAVEEGQSPGLSADSQACMETEQAVTQKSKATFQLAPHKSRLEICF